MNGSFAPNMAKVAGLEPALPGLKKSGLAIISPSKSTAYLSWQNWQDPPAINHARARVAASTQRQHDSINEIHPCQLCQCEHYELNQQIRCVSGLATSLDLASVERFPYG